MLEREGLERRACECYAVVRKEYERLLTVPTSLWRAGLHGPSRAAWASVQTQSWPAPKVRRYNQGTRHEPQESPTGRARAVRHRRRRRHPEAWCALVQMRDDGKERLPKNFRSVQPFIG